MLDAVATKVIQEKIGYSFKDKALLTVAFTHSSYANLNGKESYERLEFLGDSVVGMIVAEALYKMFPEEDEGFLTKVKSKIVNADSLGKKVKSMDIMQYMLTADNNVAHEVGKSIKMNCDLFEAIVGAIMLDSGIEACKAFILFKLSDIIAHASSNIDAITDYKSRLLEWCAKRGKKATFSNENTKLASGELAFKCTLEIDGKFYGSGEATSKKRAEQIASQVAIKKIK